MKLKRNFIILMVVIMTFSSVTLSNGKSKINTLDEKATVLNQLNILLGDGTGYNLQNQLKRSEAVTFIVGFLNAKGMVEGNKEDYNKTSFKDVSENTWYAPYVGYCVQQGIIRGFDEHTFAPEGTLTEKAFLTMVLTALGYKIDVDFDWNNVFRFSHITGLVRDSEYLIRVEDNTQFTRGDVVNVLYTALKLEHRQIKEPMFERFIREGIITQKQGVEFGFIENDIQVDIKEINVTSNTEVEIIFNKNISVLDKYKIYITYEAENQVRQLQVKEIVPQDNLDTFILIFNEREMRPVEYNINILEIVDHIGTISQNIENKFQGYITKEVQSDYFKISRVEAISNKEINVYFTQPLNNISGNFYSFYKNGSKITEINSNNIVINKLANTDKGISIFLRDYIFDSIDSYDYYELAIDGAITSAYGVRLNDNKGDIMYFSPTEKESEPLTLNEIKVINSNTIQMFFNREVNPIIARQIFNYYITDNNNNPIRVKSAKVIDIEGHKGRTVVLTTESNLIYNTIHKIMINNINDITRQFSIQEKEYNFLGYYVNSNDVKIEGAVSLDNHTIVLKVDKPLDQESAVLEFNYYISGMNSLNYGTQPLAVYYDNKIDPYTIKLFLPLDKPLTTNNYYNVEIRNSIMDHLGNFQQSHNNKSFSIYHYHNYDMGVQISNAITVGQDTIKVTLNKEIGLKVPNVLNTNYTLSYEKNGVKSTKQPIGFTYINPTTIVLRFDILEEGIDYNISFNELVDFGGKVTSRQDSVSVKQGVK
ncbi:S-layer family protein [Natranaerovirga pectinivora]|uniref:S-layer family protein n=1 Tax=Natranaerovirga pectinivora TaxID=682400 RepID=A0A4R3MKH2_9FIRM|nr:S-layer homology domain-containing protein [Natranaerovirga pectinivora]TCT12942.1 S-layer family protein [Natranaerovirga pectinivora]